MTPSFRRQVFRSLHDLSHPGIKATQKLIAQRFVWVGMQRDCKEWTKACVRCQKNKVTRHVSSSIGKFSEPQQRFQHIHMDLVGPLPHADGYNYVMTCVDRFTRWPEAIPLSDISASTVAKAFINNWIARYGVPGAITTDQGRQFESHLFSELTKQIGTTHLRTTAYHPAANGMVERLHRQLKAAIRCHENENWVNSLPLVLLGIRNAVKEDIGATPAEMVYGSSLKLPGEFFAEDRGQRQSASTFVNLFRDELRKLRPAPASRHGNSKVFVYKELTTSPFVFIRNDAPKPSLQSTYEGPFKVIKRSQKFYLVQMGNKNVNVSIDRLKPAYILSEDDDAYKPTQQANANNAEKTTNSTVLSDGDKKQSIVTRSGRKVKIPDRY